MRLVLFRHGPAGNAAKLALPDDSLRPLTGKGRKRTRAAAHGLTGLGVAPQVAITSPYTRAEETARIVLHAIGADVTLAASDSLVPDAEPAATMRMLRKLNEDTQEVILFGHQPHLGDLGAHLLGLARPAPLRMRKAGIAVFDLERLKRPYGACLELLVGPDELVRLGQA